MICAEWCGFTPFPWGRGPINFEPGGEEEARAMAVFDAWTRLIELQPTCSWIIDRFHLSARAHQIAEHGHDVDFRWLGEQQRPDEARPPPVRTPGPGTADSSDPVQWHGRL